MIALQLGAVVYFICRYCGWTVGFVTTKTLGHGHYANDPSLFLLFLVFL